ncbi:MAG: acetyl-CoA carboxylase biotin carboxyl carrier protein [Ruminococcus sp.]|nr:acetyl-CoA carboxylase biotin carboxyl carrier protein [Ruminococcus sp.]
MYSIDQIKQMIEMLENSQLAVLELKDDNGSSIRLEKPSSPAVHNFAVNTGTQGAAIPAQAPVQPVTAEQNTAAEAPVTDNCSTIKSPMVGVFYAAASPDSSPFVTVGQRVEKGDVVCIIEAMKLMNEITAEQSGVITEICVNNEDIVEYGQDLFKIK